jgi:hypothetical protein
LVGTTRLSWSIKARIARATPHTASAESAKGGKAFGPRVGTLATTAPVAKAAVNAQRAHENRPVGGWAVGGWAVGGWAVGGWAVGGWAVGGWAVGGWHPPPAAVIQPASFTLVRQYQPTTPAAQAATAMTIVCMEPRSPPFSLLPARDMTEVQKDSSERVPARVGPRRRARTNSGWEPKCSRSYRLYDDKPTLRQTVSARN